MEENQLSTNDVVELLKTTIKPVSIRTVKAWVADTAVNSSRTPPAKLVDELELRLKNQPSQPAS